MIRYRVFSPAGNITALVRGTPEAHAEQARAIMRADKNIEQVGFVEEGGEVGNAFHLRMMGDEFCGNAAACAALLWHRENAERDFAFSVSGLADPLQARITNEVTLTFAPEFRPTITAVPEGHQVDLEGIRLIVSATKRTLQDIPAILDRYEDGVPAIGYIETIRDESGHGVRIRPWIRVADTGTLVAESACASGSIAVALVTKQAEGIEKIRIEQPSGLAITVEAGTQLTITIPVAYVDERVTG